MTDIDELAQKRDRDNRYKYATRRLVREMGEGERDFERRMQAFDAAIDGAKHTIEKDSPVAHRGPGSARRWAWRANGSAGTGDADH
jgi:hypothetical protein